MTPAEELREAVMALREEGLRSEEVVKPLTVWLEACAGQAAYMAGPTDWGICDEPGSVQHAVDVARVINGSATP